MVPKIVTTCLYVGSFLGWVSKVASKVALGANLADFRAQLGSQTDPKINQKCNFLSKTLKTNAYKNAKLDHKAKCKIRGAPVTAPPRGIQ